jgi:uncharacterized protein YktA (UPF0223 family)
MKNIININVEELDALLNIYEIVEEYLNGIRKKKDLKAALKNYNEVVVSNYKKFTEEYVDCGCKKCKKIVKKNHEYELQYVEEWVEVMPPFLKKNI